MAIQFGARFNVIDPRRNPVAEYACARHKREDNVGAPASLYLLTAQLFDTQIRNVRKWPSASSLHVFQQDGGATHHQPGWLSATEHPRWDIERVHSQEIQRLRERVRTGADAERLCAYVAQKMTARWPRRQRRLDLQLLTSSYRMVNRDIHPGNCQCLAGSSATRKWRQSMPLAPIS